MRMFYRQKFLMKLLSLLPESGRASRTYLMKAAFLVTREFEEKPYQFFPYKYGPYSSVLEEDLRFLAENKYVETDTWKATPKGLALAREIGNGFIKEKAQALGARFRTATEIREYVYAAFPEFTVRSTLVPHTRNTVPGVSAVGYEGDTIDGFLNKLIQGNVDMLVDVRKNAFSMKTHFRRQALEHALEKSGIEYLHVPALGIDSDKRQNLETPADYKRLFEEYRAELPAKENELNRLLELSKTKRLALMCFERDPQSCHRGVLADRLTELGQRVEFI